VSVTGDIRRLRRRVLGSLAGKGPREPGPVNVVSLGSHCHVAHWLKEAGLRGWSGPFDWIFSAPGMVRECLEDDFATLLDRRHLESVPLAERVAPEVTRGRHTIYGPRHGVPFVFNHHDPAGSDADYAFLSEGVRRLRGALARPGARNTFFLMHAAPVGEADLVGIAAALARTPARNRLVVIAHASGAEHASAQVAPGPVDNVRIVTLATRNPSFGLRFADPGDDDLFLDLLRTEAARPFEEPCDDGPAAPQPAQALP
jgi:hypothetical protein